MIKKIYIQTWLTVCVWLLMSSTFFLYSQNQFLGPVITQNPSNATIPLGETASFQVTVSPVFNAKELSYQWLKNNVAIAGATAFSYSYMPTINDNGAEFKCIVTNTLGYAVYKKTSNVATLTVQPFSLATVKALVDQHYFVSDGKPNSDGTGTLSEGVPIKSVTGKLNAAGGLCLYSNENEVSINDPIPNRNYNGTGGIPRYFTQNGGYLSIANGTAIGYENESYFDKNNQLEEIHIIRLHGGQDFEAIVTAGGNGNYGGFKRWSPTEFRYFDNAYTNIYQPFTYAYSNFTTILWGMKTDPVAGTCQIWVSDDLGDIRVIFNGTAATGQLFTKRTIGTTSSHPYSFDWFGSVYKFGSFFSDANRQTICSTLKSIYSVGQTPSKSFARPTMTRTGNVYTITPNYVLKGGATSIDAANTVIKWYAMDKVKAGVSFADPFRQIKLVATTNGNQLSLDVTTILVNGEPYEVGSGKDQLIASIEVYDNLGKGFERDCETPKVF